MNVVAPLIVIVVLTVIVLLVSAPLRGGASARAEERAEVRRADLEAAREAKYHEIRDAELDYRTGKMSQADWRRLDRELRAEAIEILRGLDELPPAPAENGTRRADEAPAAARQPASKAKQASKDKRAPKAARAAKERPAAKEPAPAPRRRKPARRK